MNKARGVCLILLVGLFAYANPTPSPPSDATATKRGLVNTTSQTFSGLKTFVDGGIIADLRTGSTFEGSPLLVGFSDGGSSFVSSTVATVNLFVDSTGNDSNACTDAGVAACLTLNGALAKLPRFIRHNVTIESGAIAFGTVLPTFGFDIADGVTLAVNGTMTAITPLTGTSSGTTTGSTALSGVTGSTLTDSTQSWTVNDLKGAFVSFTTGTLAGRAFPIYENTATTLSIFQNVGAAGTGVPYTIVRPGTTFNTTSNSVIYGTGGGTLQLKNVQVSRTGGTALNVNTGNELAVTLLNVDVRSTTGSGVFVAAGKATVSASYINSAQTCANGSSSRPSGASVSVQYSLLVSTAGSAFFSSITGSGNGNTIFISVIEGGSSSSPVINVAGVYGQQMVTARITCTGGASSVGLGTGLIGSTSGWPRGSNGTFNTGLYIKNCGTGIALNGNATWYINSPTFDNVTTAIALNKGGQFDFLGTTPSFVGVTNEIQLDGVNYTLATLSATGPPAVLTNVYGSRIIR